MKYEVGNMDNQEMQFADPAWQPSQQRGDAATPQQSYTPQPINRDGYEQMAFMLDILHSKARRVN